MKHEMCVSDAAPVGGSTQLPQSSPPAGTSSPPIIAADTLPPVGDTEEEDGMTHMQQVSAGPVEKYLHPC